MKRECWHCSVRMDDDLSASLKESPKDKHSPREGDVGFCGSCGRPHVLTSESCRSLSSEDWIELRTDVRFMQSLAYITSWVQYQETLHQETLQ